MMIKLEISYLENNYISLRKENLISMGRQITFSQKKKKTIICG